MTGIVRSKEEIDRLLKWAEDGPRYPGITYEEGVRDALKWLFGSWSPADPPLPDATVRRLESKAETAIRRA